MTMGSKTDVEQITMNMPQEANLHSSSELRRMCGKFKSLTTAEPGMLKNAETTAKGGAIT